MFRSIKRVVDKKEKSLSKTDIETMVIKEILEQFMKRSFRGFEDFLNFKTEYDSRSRRLFIITESKILANEISMKVGKIGRLLKEKKIDVAQIIIH